MSKFVNDANASLASGYAALSKIVKRVAVRVVSEGIQMAGYRARDYGGPWLDQDSSYVSAMTKRYQLVRESVLTPAGGFVEAVKMAIFEFGCLGERRFDLSGYPHQSENHALASDWDKLGQDALSATAKFRNEISHNHITDAAEVAAQIVRVRAELEMLQQRLAGGDNLAGGSPYVEGFRRSGNATPQARREAGAATGATTAPAVRRAEHSSTRGS